MNEEDLDILLGAIEETNQNIGEAINKDTPKLDKLEEINQNSFMSFMESIGDIEELSNINILDDEENASEINVVTPESILNEYSDLDLKNEELEAQIEEIKLKNPEIFNKIKEIENLQKENLDKQSKLKDDLKQALIDNNQKSVKNDFWTVTYIAEHTKTTFDREKFEKKYPVLAQQFTKVSTVSDSTRWTKKK